ncbi:MAG: hypothetical protein IT379_39330 [Deltaproteobacteria bacterium]|nr:hypothetical protein [Deltaproteobacteria bacterium]
MKLVARRRSHPWQPERLELAGDPAGLVAVRELITSALAESVVHPDKEISKELDIAALRVSVRVT